MKKLMNKKGFTIVELVVVVAVIAVLVAVLIPTFTGIIKKANAASDQQEIRQMSTVLATEIDEEAPKTLEEAVDILEAKGFTAESLKAKDKEGAFYWYKSLNAIVLVKEKEEDGQKVKYVAFPEDEKFADFATDFAKGGDEKELFNLYEEGAKYIDVVASNQNELQAALELGTKNIKLEKDIKIKKAITVAEDSEIYLDLNGKKLDATKQRPFDMSDGSKLVVNAAGSTIEMKGAGIYGLVNVQGVSDVEVEINGGNYVANLDNGAFIRVRNDAKNVKVTLNNVNYIDTSADSFVVNKNTAGDNFELYVNGGSFTAQSGFQVENGMIKDAVITTKAVAFEASEGNFTVDKCTITVGTNVVGSAPAAALAVSANGVATIKNSTINFTEGTQEQHAYAVYTSGGTITATDNTVNTADANKIYKIYDQDLVNYPTAVATVIIDGVKK